VVVLLAASDAPADVSAYPSWVVKITSSSCDQRRVFRGSGLLLRHGGKGYVLTSDHVILHGNTGYCHGVWSPLFSRQHRARYLVADWGSGLGLLELESDAPVGQDWPEISDLARSLPAAWQSAAVTGYPAGSNELVDNRTAKLDPAPSRQDFFVQVPEVLHLNNGQGEFGMSGGPVFTEVKETSGGHTVVAGILSHQKLETEDGEIKNQIYAIPAPHARAWLERYFADPEHFELTFFQTPENQVPGGLVVSGRFWWSYSAGNSVNSPTISPIISKKAWTAKEPTDPQGWIASLVNYLDSHPSMVSTPWISLLRAGSSLDYPVVETPVSGLVQFFRTLAEGTQRPVGQVSNDEKRIESAAKAAQELGYTEREYCGQSARNTGDAAQLCSRINALAYGIASADSIRPGELYQRWRTIPGHDVVELLDAPKYQAGWKALEQWNPAAARELRKDLQKLFAEMDLLVF
jgi:hypothetical protein